MKFFRGTFKSQGISGVISGASSNSGFFQGFQGFQGSLATLYNKVCHCKNFSNNFCKQILNMYLRFCPNIFVKLMMVRHDVPKISLKIMLFKTSSFLVIFFVIKLITLSRLFVMKILEKHLAFYEICNR